MSGSQLLAGMDFLTVVVSREQIQSGDVSSPLAVLKQLLTPEMAVKFCEKVDICVDGYNDYPGDLNEIPEVRDFVYKLDAEFPYWCYFLSKRHPGLAFILSCFCPPYLSSQARDRIWSDTIAQYLTRRGFPAMNHLCEAIGCSEAEIQRLTNRVAEYITEGIDRSEA